MKEAEDKYCAKNHVCFSLTQVQLACRYKRELQDRYCYRQAELGVGDCGGLQVSLEDLIILHQLQILQAPLL